MTYDDKLLYIAEDKDKLVADLHTRYNEYLANLDANFTGISLDEFRGSNIYFIFEFFLKELQSVDENFEQLLPAINSFLQRQNAKILDVKKSSFDGVRNSLLGVEVVDGAFLYSPSSKNLPSTLGTIEPILLLKEGVTPSPEINGVIANTLLNSVGAGILCTGDVSVELFTGVTQLDVGFSFAERLDLKIKLTFTSGSSFGALPISEDRIKDIFIEEFVKNYSLGADLIPRLYIDLNRYAGLTGLDCEISITNGASYLPVNSVLKVGANPLFGKKTFCVVKKENIEVNVVN